METSLVTSSKRFLLSLHPLRYNNLTVAALRLYFLLEKLTCLPSSMIFSLLASYLSLVCLFSSSSSV